MKTVRSKSTCNSKKEKGGGSTVSGKEKDDSLDGVIMVGVVNTRGSAHSLTGSAHSLTEHLAYSML